jgi:hypothetical protein
MKFLSLLVEKMVKYQLFQKVQISTSFTFYLYKDEIQLPCTSIGKYIKDELK